MKKFPLIGELVGSVIVEITVTHNVQYVRALQKTLLYLLAMPLVNTWSCVSHAGTLFHMSFLIACTGVFLHVLWLLFTVGNLSLHVKAFAHTQKFRFQFPASKSKKLSGFPLESLLCLESYCHIDKHTHKHTHIHNMDNKSAGF